MSADKEADLSAQRGDSFAAATVHAARWIGLVVDLQAPRTWFGPSWAYLCGVLASGGLNLQTTTLALVALGWVLVEPLLGSLAALTVEAARLWRGKQAEAPAAWHWTLPYVQPGTPGQRVLDRLARWAARGWLHWQTIEPIGVRWLLLATATLAMGWLLGGYALGVTLVALAAMLVAAAARALRVETRPVLGTLQLLLAWLVGRGAFATLDWRTLLLGALYAAAWYAWTQRPPIAWTLVVTQLATAALLVWGHAPISAAGCLLLAVPLAVQWPENANSQRAYLQHTQLFLMASLLMAAWGLGWGF
jgi:hypothetical protein